MFNYKTFETGSGIMLAVCDSELIGRVLSSGDLEILISTDFYGTKQAKSVLEIAKKSAIINAFGNRIVNLLIEAGIIDKNSVLEIDGVKHAQLILL